MPRLTDDDYADLQAELDRDTARPLGRVRRAQGSVDDDARRAWLAAGDNLAEKTIAALDLGDLDRADRLAARIAALPTMDEDVRSGPMAVSLLLYTEILDPAFDDEVEAGLLDAPLRLLPTLEPAVAAELRHVLAALTDQGLPAALERRIRAVTPFDARFDAPFAGVPEVALPAALLGVLRLVLRLRAVEQGPE